MCQETYESIFQKLRNAMKTKLKFLSILSFALLLAACEEKLPNIKGRYQGSQITGSSKVQLIGQIPDLTSLGKTKVSIFKLYPTLASSSGEQYSIVILDEKTVELEAPQLPQNGVRLRLHKNNCATGSTESQDISLCLDQGALDLVFAHKSEPEKSTAIHLVRDDSLPSVETNKTYSLDELVGRAKYLNYSSAQDAEKVFQAKQNIGVTRGNLLPRLNLKSLIGVFLEDFLPAVGTTLPFLFPSNWFHWKVSKELYQAEKNSFASLRGNIMNSIEELYYLILRDQWVLDRLRKHLAWMKETQEGLKREEAVGILPQGTADYFGTSIALLERDRINFETLVRTHYSQLAQATALPPINGIRELVPVEFPALDHVTPIDSSDFYKEAKEKSYEITSLNFLLKSAQYSQEAISYSFFDLDETSGIGFGTPYQIEVAKSKQHEIQRKVEEVISLIELKSSFVETEHNQALESYRVATSGLNSIEKRLKWLIDRHLQGDGTMDENEFVDQLIDLQYNIISFSADQATAIQGWRMAKAKMDRLLLKGYYSDLLAALPEEPKE
jgi:hypothetical protein